MQTWMWALLLFGLVKLPIAGLMLWMPFRYDESQQPPVEASDSSEEDGGSKALPGGPLNPHPRSPLPRLPRRGPHGGPSLPEPPRPRLRTAAPRQPLRVGGRR
jgi:hypothetical protein